MLADETAPEDDENAVSVRPQKLLRQKSTVARSAGLEQCTSIAENLGRRQDKTKETESSTRLNRDLTGHHGTKQGD